MAKCGDYYITALKKSHIGWGTYRNTGSRDPISGEGYLAIPKEYARKFDLLNSKGTNGQDILGKNIFKFSTADGFITDGYLKAQGNSDAGDPYAKQFAGNDDLKLLGTWYEHINAADGTEIKVEWLSSEEVLLSMIK